MSFVRHNRHPTARQLAQFGAAWTALFLLLAALAWWRSSAGIPWLLILVAIIPPLIGWKDPRVMRLLFVACSALTFPIGWLMSQCILVMIFYGIVTPIGVVLRLIKPGFFPKHPDPSRSSYWIDRTKNRTASDSLKPY